MLGKRGFYSHKPSVDLLVCVHRSLEGGASTHQNTAFVTSPRLSPRSTPDSCGREIAGTGEQLTCLLAFRPIPFPCSSQIAGDWPSFQVPVPTHFPLGWASGRHG